VFSLFCGFLVDLCFALHELWVMKSLRGWEFDELEEKSTAKKNEFPIFNLKFADR